MLGAWGSALSDPSGMIQVSYTEPFRHVHALENLCKLN